MKSKELKNFLPVRTRKKLAEGREEEKRHSRQRQPYLEKSAVQRNGKMFIMAGMHWSSLFQGASYPWLSLIEG